MRRRDLLAAASVLVAAPFALGQIMAKPRRVGWLTGGSPASHAKLLAAFRQGLRERGWEEGRNIELELHWADGEMQRLPALAAQLVRSKPDVILTAANVVHLAVRKETASIPIVMATGGDPVADGLAASFARPGGNVTGLSGFYDELPPKLMELTATLLPRGARATILLDSATPWVRRVGIAQLETVAKEFHLQPSFVDAANSSDLARALALAGPRRAAVLIVMSSSALFALRQRILQEAAAAKVPVVSVYEEMTELGALMSYAIDLPDSYRRAAYYVDRILRGAKPGELPIEQPTRISLAFNLKTAKAFGIKIPPTLLRRADRVIE